MKHNALFALIACTCAAHDAAAATREGVRVLGNIRFHDVNGDAAEDWLVGRAECFTKAEGQAEVKSWCVALLDGRSWTPLWRKNVPGFGSFPPALAGHWVVLDVGEPVFTAFDATRADVFWEFRIDGVHTAPMTPVGNHILIAVGGDHLYYIDLEARRPKWDQRLWSPLRLPPALVDGRAAVATERELLVLDLATGRIVWRMRGEVSALAAGRKDVVFVAYRRSPGPHTISALALAGGERRWIRRNLLTLDLPLLVGQDQVFAFGNGQLVALDRSDGSAVWKVPIRGTPTLVGADTRVVVALVERRGAHQEIQAYDRETGKRLWVRKADVARYEPRAVLTAGMLVLWSRDRPAVGALRGRAQGMVAATGEELWAHDASEKLVALLSADERAVRLQRERGFTVLETRTGRELMSRGTVALARAEKPIGERLRYLVYVLPPLIIVTGIGVWIRHRLRRRG